MKKTLVKFFAGVTAAASLLMAGCTNQLDYLDETVALNKFNVLGLYVEGLNESYNNAPVTLSVKEGEDFVSYAEGKVADSYTKDGKVVGYKSGTAYIKLDTPKVFDGDKLETSTFECYITVGADKFLKVAADGLTTENAKLSVPTSPAKTKNADLKGRWVTVNVANGTPTYSLESSAKEPVNVTLYNIKLDLLSCTAETLPTGVTVSKVAKEGTNQKFTLKLTGLKDNAGTDVVLGGSDISSTDKDLKDNWHDRTNFKKTISAEGTVEWTFYGSAVNGGNISAWGRTYTAEQAGPEIVIVDTTGKDQNDGNKLLQSSVSREGKEGDSMNFMFPAYTIGDFDVTCTIDVASLADSSKSKADPVCPESVIKINAIYIKDAPTPENNAIYLTTPDGYGSDKQKASSWKIPENSYNQNCHRYVSADLINGNFEWGFDVVEVKPYGETFSLGIRLMDSEDNAKKEFNWGDDDITDKGICTPYYSTKEYANGTYTLYWDYKAELMYLIPTDKVKFDYTIRKVYLVGATSATKVTIGSDLNGNTGTDEMIKDGTTGWVWNANLSNEKAKFKFIIDDVNWIGTRVEDSSWTESDLGQRKIIMPMIPGKTYDLVYTLSEDGSSVISYEVK